MRGAAVAFGSRQAEKAGARAVDGDLNTFCRLDG